MLSLHKKRCTKDQKERQNTESIFLKESLNITLRLLIISSMELAILYIFHRLVNFSSDLGSDTATEHYAAYSKKLSSQHYNGYFSEMKTYRIDGKVREAYLLDTDKKILYSVFSKNKDSERSRRGDSGGTNHGNCGKEKHKSIERKKFFESI